MNMWGSIKILGVLEPSPFPFLPLPKEIINRVEGLSPYKVYVLRPPNIIEEAGRVWGADKEEAEEAAECLIGEGPDVLAIGVDKERLFEVI